jgi:hypothetical protein
MNSHLNRSSLPHNKQLQRSVSDKVPSHIRQHAAAELRRYAPLWAGRTRERT